MFNPKFKQLEIKNFLNIICIDGIIINFCLIKHSNRKFGINFYRIMVVGMNHHYYLGDYQKNYLLAFLIMDSPLTNYIDFP